MIIYTFLRRFNSNLLHIIVTKLFKFFIFKITLREDIGDQNRLRFKCILIDQTSTIIFLLFQN